jgi:hypothetical protein
MVKDGFGHYEDMCAGCHGGPGIERSEIGKGLNPSAPNLADAVPAWSPRQEMTQQAGPDTRAHSPATTGPR